MNVFQLKWDFGEKGRLTRNFFKVSRRTPNLSSEPFFLHTSFISSYSAILVDVEPGFNASILCMLSLSFIFYATAADKTSDKYFSSAVDPLEVSTIGTLAPTINPAIFASAE